MEETPSRGAVVATYSRSNMVSKGYVALRYNNVVDDPAGSGYGGTLQFASWVDATGALRLSHWTGTAWQHDSFSGLAVRQGTSPSSYRGADGTQWISWVDSAGVLRLSHWTGSVWQHDNLGSQVAVDSSPSAFADPGGHPNIVWVDAAGVLRLTRWTGTAWQVDNFGLAVMSGSSPSAYLG
ncbi:MAG: hypothetical protein FWH11_04150 [Micrococcales bacterium]|nr:hypothetical protein [Micrococcales bacterium]